MNTRSKTKKKTHTRSTKALFDELPRELFDDILRRISVKTFIKMRSISKYWNSLILNHQFNMTLIQHQLQLPRTKYLCRPGEIQPEIVVRRTDSFKRDTDNNLYTPPIMFQNPRIDRVVSYVHGVLLMLLESEYAEDVVELVLWNPSTRKSLEIPCFHPDGWDTKDTKFGFGFDLESNTYKVVALCMANYKQNTKVYNLSHKSWSAPKQRKTPIPQIFFTQFTTPIIHENQMFWLGSNVRKRVTELTHLVRFDLSKESFTLIKLPPMERGNGLQNHKICSAVLDNNLVLLDCYDTPGGQHGSVWKGTKTDSGYEWSKLYSLDIKLKNVENSQRHKFEMWFRNLPQGLNSVEELKNHDDFKMLSRINWTNVKFLDRYIESLALLQELDDIDRMINE